MKGCALRMALSTLPAAVPLAQLCCSSFEQKTAPLRMSPLPEQRARKVNECGMGEREREQPLSQAGKRTESPRQDKGDLGMLAKAREDGDRG